MSIENFGQLADYNHWTNRRLYAAALEMSDEQYRRTTGVFFGSLHGTLNHLLLADRVWLKRLTGEGSIPTGSMRSCLTIVANWRRPAWRRMRV